VGRYTARITHTDVLDNYHAVHEVPVYNLKIQSVCSVYQIIGPIILNDVLSNSQSLSKSPDLNLCNYFSCGHQNKDFM